MQYRSGGAKQETAQRLRNPLGLVHLQTAPGEQGPDILLEPFNPQTDQKTTLNLIVALFVVFPDADVNELKTLLLNHTAGLLIVLFDPVTGGEAINSEVIEEVMVASDLWDCQALGTSGVVMYKKVRIRSVAFIESVSKAGEASVLQTMRVVFHGNTMFLLPVGVMFLLPENIGGSFSLPYSSALLKGIKATLTSQQVRILLGVFLCPPAQVSDIAHSCGAIGGRPFCQMFYRDHAQQACTQQLAERFEVDRWDGGNYVTHPSYGIVFGPCAKHAHAPTKDVPFVPQWLDDVGVRFNSLVRSLRDIPSWEEDQGLRSGGYQLLDLGNVKQKTTNMGWWVPRVHQLMVYVGTSRTGMGAKNAKRIKNNS